MNIEDDLPTIAAIALGRNSPLGRNSTSDLHALCQELESEYQRRRADQRELQALTDAVAECELGPAAYAIGVHYALHGDELRAERWLRLAAERSIGDAALRLARICERREVRSFNVALELDLDTDRGSSLTPDVLSEAHYWYQRAAEEGYGSPGAGERKRSDQPLVDFACCKAEVRPAAEATADAILAKACAEADEIVQRARDDARLIEADARAGIRDVLDTARREWSSLTTGAQLINKMTVQIYDDACPTPRGRKIRAWIGSVLGWRYWVVGKAGAEDFPQTLHPLDLGFRYTRESGIIYGRH